MINAGTRPRARLHCLMTLGKQADKPGFANRNDLFEVREDMNTKKIVSLISAICALLVGIAIIAAAVLDAELPKPLWLLFAVCNLVNAIIIIVNFRK